MFLLRHHTDAPIIATITNSPPTPPAKVGKWTVTFVNPPATVEYALPIVKKLCNGLGWGGLRAVDQ